MPERFLLNDPVALTRSLLQFNTINPPGNEQACAAFIADLMSVAGWSAQLLDFEPGRQNLILRHPAHAEGDPLILSGHLDTVPLGQRPWSHSPFDGEVAGDRLFGRGSTDMKGGIATLLCAAVRFTSGRLRRPLWIVLTAGEEIGCAGAVDLRSKGSLRGSASGLLIAEPTGNDVCLGHKGALYLKAECSGVTAHSSMPETGDNAVYKAAAAICRVAAHRFSVDDDPLLGRPSLNVGMIRGGQNVNSVPDFAEFTIDVRSTGVMRHSTVQEELATVTGPEVRLNAFVDMPPVSTDPADPFVQCVFDVVRTCRRIDPQPRAMPFFTDASVFQSLLGAPAVILGPGDTRLAHQTDESVGVGSLEQAVEMYDGIIHAWCDPRP